MLVINECKKMLLRLPNEIFTALHLNVDELFQTLV